jgi:hypothetical protein
MSKWQWRVSTGVIILGACLNLAAAIGLLATH